jgi:hypothetical protein
MPLKTGLSPVWTVCPLGAKIPPWLSSCFPLSMLKLPQMRGPIVMSKPLKPINGQILAIAIINRCDMIFLGVL